MNPALHFDLSVVINVVDEELKIAFDRMRLSADNTIATSTYFTGSFQNIRFAMLADQMAISDTWRDIRKIDCVVDLIMDLTLIVRFGADSVYPDGWDRLCTLVANTMSVFNHGKVNSHDSVLEDEGELDRFTSTASANKFVLSNPWLVTLFVLRYSEEIRSLTRDVVAAGVRLQARPGDAGEA